ncbi:MAG: hypothetical protein Q4D79_13490 [Propionibacteriaceae bacterium]|nr:hypothetical protein [Propionibacteriaceae bacterium]
MPDDRRFCPECGSDTSRAGKAGDSEEAAKARAFGVEYLCVSSAIVGLLALQVQLLGITGVVAMACGVKGALNCMRERQPGQELAILGFVLGLISTGMVVATWLDLS